MNICRCDSVIHPRLLSPAFAKGHSWRCSSHGEHPQSIIQLTSLMVLSGEVDNGVMREVKWVVEGRTFFSRRQRVEQPAAGKGRHHRASGLFVGTSPTLWHGFYCGPCTAYHPPSLGLQKRTFLLASFTEFTTLQKFPTSSNFLTPNSPNNTLRGSIRHSLDQPTIKMVRLTSIRPSTMASPPPVLHQAHFAWAQVAFAAMRCTRPNTVDKSKLTSIVLNRSRT